jgi:hypothetical protein
MKSKTRLRMCAFVAIIVVVVSVFAGAFMPAFSGTFITRDGSRQLIVSNDDGVLRVSDTITGNRVSFNAHRTPLSIVWGTGIEGGAIVFHPAYQYELQTGCERVTLDRQSWLGDFTKAHPYVMMALACVVVVTFISFVLGDLAKREPRLIYPVWLAFFVALFGSTAVLWAAGQANIFDIDGRPITAVAGWIFSTVGFILDIQHETFALVALLSVFALPQWCAYVMSGLTGTASEVRFLKQAWKLAALLLSKSCISASAVAMSVDVVGSLYGWINIDPRNLMSHFLVEVLLLLYGWFLLCLSPRNQRPQVNHDARQARWQTWMTRRIGAETAPQPIRKPTE